MTVWQDLREDVMKDEAKGEKLLISQLPSGARVCMNLIVIPQDCNHTKKPKKVQNKIPNNEKQIIEGLVLGSIQVSCFDKDLKLRQRERQCRLWPHKEFNPRMVCAGDYLVTTLVGGKYESDMTLDVEFPNLEEELCW